MSYSPLISGLIEALRCLPGVGPRSAQRMALRLLQQDRDGGRRLAAALTAALEQVGECSGCRLPTEEPQCGLCASERRDPRLLCVVEQPGDVFALERSTDYRGRYFVLHGRLSPLDGIGPEQLGLDRLEARLQAESVDELILAVSPTVEGEATAQYLLAMAADAGVGCSRIAHGVPVGGELEFVDGGTLSHAFAGRRPFR